MSIQVVRRRFVLNGTDLPDPDPTLTPEEVRSHYEDMYPELANGKVVRDGEVHEEEVYLFKVSVGHKG